MIEVGVASPIAHGQAMMSTATALTSAKVKRRLRTEHEPDKEGERGNDHHGRHEPGGHLVDHRLDRQLRALRLLDHADDLRQHRVRPDLGRAEGEGARLVDRAADDFGARALGNRRPARR